jgi:hypothetical protein
VKLDGDNALHRALEAFYGERDPYPCYELDGRTHRPYGAWRCSACDPGEFAPHRLTVALDEDGEPPRCSNGCSEDAIWRALGRARPSPPDRKRTPVSSSAPLLKRTVAATVPRKRTKARSPGANTHRDGNTQRDEKRLEENNISMGVVPEGVASEVVGDSNDQGSKVAPSRNEARAHALRLPSAPGIDFACVLPGHEHGARLITRERGLWQYQCDEHKQLSLAEVHAARATGRVAPLSRVLASRWLERLDYEAGLREPRPVPITLADNFSEATVKVARGIELFLGLRDKRWEGEAFTFARNFIIAYCGVTDDEARWAMRVLEREGVICRDGKSRRAIVWRLVEEPS